MSDESKLKELKLWLDERYNESGDMRFIEAGNALIELTERRPGAECWDALAACYRITCMGYAGLPPGEPHANGYAHATFNLWTRRGPGPEGATGDEQDLQGRKILSDFMLVAIANNKP